MRDQITVTTSPFAYKRVHGKTYLQILVEDAAEISERLTLIFANGLTPAYTKASGNSMQYWFDASSCASPTAVNSILFVYDDKKAFASWMKRHIDDGIEVIMNDPARHLLKDAR